MESVGRYEIRELIGQGAMARVYKAYDPAISRTLAIKLLRSELLADDEHRARFLREAKGAGVLSHPHIVTVFDVGVTADKQPYIAMELVEGGTLVSLLESDRPVPVKTVVDVGIQLARALDYAHKHGIVHRDLKPGNIMLLKSGLTIKVADFGICHIEDPDATQRTQAGTVVGTPHYMSPEQVLGQGVDSRTDIFAAGVVLYQLLTKALPFQGESFITVAYKITKEEPAPPIETLRTDVPQSLRRVIERALKKDPTRRFASGEEMAQALTEVAAEIAETEAALSKPRGLPLSVRWAITMACLVALTMSITAAYVYRTQYRAMADMVMSYGSSLAKFMASQNAVPLLAEDWAPVEAFVATAAEQQDFNHLVIVDRQNVVRGSTHATELGKTYSKPGGTPLETRNTGVKVVQYRHANRHDVIDFVAPVLFQGKQIGEVHLGIKETPLTEVASLTLGLIGLLIVVTSIAVGLGSYVLANRLAAPMRTLRKALEALGKGHLDHRIGETRKDEFGELFVAFDRAAESLDHPHAKN